MATPESRKPGTSEPAIPIERTKACLASPDQPVEYLDSYAVDGGQAAPGSTRRTRAGPFAHELLADLEPKNRTFPAGTHAQEQYRLIRSTTFMRLT